MNLSTIDRSEMPYLRITDFENLFNIYQDKKNNYFYNLNATLYLDIPDDKTLTYINDYDSQWPLLSYKLYGTTRLAWLLMKINKVQSKDVFKLIKAGETIKYVPKDIMNGLIASLNNFE